MQNQFKQRRKYRDPETCCTPPLVEDNLWTTMDDDPFGVYHSLGMCNYLFTHICLQIFCLHLLFV